MRTWLMAGVTAPGADKLIVELGAIAVARALLMLRDLIQRLTHPPACIVEKVPNSLEAK